MKGEETTSPDLANIIKKYLVWKEKKKKKSKKKKKQII
jgi:hypothetical protein